MKKSLFIAALAACVLSACAVEPVPGSTEEPMVYREYTATIADDATKVTFGEAADGKVPVSWTEGDLVLLSDGTTGYSLTVSAINGSSATLTGETAASFTPTAAYYPASMYDASGNFTLGKQTYGSVPAPMTGTVSDNAITFSAAEGYAVIRYSLTGDITIKEARLYLTDDAGLLNISPLYTLTFSENLTLTSTPQDIYFVVASGESKSVTLEVKTSAPKTALSTSDYSYYRRKVTPITLTDKNVIELPALDFTESELLEGSLIWKFGSKYSQDAGWVTKNSTTIDGTTNDYFAVVPMLDGGNDTEHNFRTDITYNKGFSVNMGTYRYMAIMSDFEQVARYGKTMPEGTEVTQGKITFDTNLLGSWHSVQANGKAGTISSNLTNVNVWYYDMYDKWTRDGMFVSTATLQTFPATDFQFKVADLKVKPGTYEGTIVAPSYKVYWVGFFNNLDEIRAQISATEAEVNASAGASSETEI